ncbi:MAG: hypothetical protein KAJ10_03570 [Thermodesulfovibrionia bacterium]|nr:hypothetical protein [Thermodesulfovibrionia bacterium]
MKTDPIRNNFNAGELSPKIDFRGDVGKYHSGCLLLQNFVPLVEGGITRMPGTYYGATVKDSSKATRAVPFRFSIEQAYIIEFGDQYVRFYKDNVQIESGGNPVEVATPYLEADLFELKFTQSADVLYIFHPDYAPRKLIRTSHTVWALQTIVFRPPPTKQFGHYPDATLTPAATTGNGIDFTAGSAQFVTGDIGRIIGSGTARASIVSLTSTSIVVCDILDDFPDTDPIASGDWQLQGSPIGDIRPSTTNQGEIITLTSTGGTGGKSQLNGFDPWLTSGGGSNEYYLPNSSPLYSSDEPDSMYMDTDQMSLGVLGTLGIEQWGWGDNDSLGYDTIYVRVTTGDPNPNNHFMERFDLATPNLFRTEDLGKYIFINNGFVKITEIVSSLSVKGEVLQSLSSTDAGIWTLEEEMWNDARGYPGVGFFYEQRLVCAGSSTFPQTLNLSVSGGYENFSRDPDADDGAMEFTLVSNQVERINWLAGSDFLMVGTFASLWKFGATTSSEPLTQVNVTAKKQGGTGAKNIAPLHVTDSIAWVDLSALRLNRLDYQFEADKFVSTNMTRLANHITQGDSEELSGIVEMAFQQSPIPIIWVVRADGVLIGMTYETQEEIYGWFRVVTDGEFESVAVISNGDEEDQIWVVVKRTIDGNTVRYMEYFKPMELFNQIEDSFFVHAGVSFDGGDPVTITGITQANPAVVSAVNTFSGGEKVRIKDVEGMTQVNQGLTKAYTVANPTGTTFELSNITSVGWGAYTSGGQAQVVKDSFTTGLDHLEGETVDIVVDGAVHSQENVVSGELSLDYYGNKIHIGLPAPATMKPTEPYLDVGEGGISRGKKQRIYQLILSFYQSYGCKIGKDLDNLTPVKFGTGGAPELVTGEKHHPFAGDWGTSVPVVVYQDLPLPLNLRALIYNMEISER